MSRPINNSSQSIDYIETIAALGEPFNSHLLDAYPEYLTTDDDQKTNTFLGALNLIGQTGCKFLYDKIINYIDDASNVSTCKLDALYSIASTLNVPYKDKQAIEILQHVVNSEDILQLLIWSMSCNTRNSKHVIKRLELAIDADLQNLTTRSAIFDSTGVVASNIKLLLKNIITKRHIAPPNAAASNIEMKMLIQYPWNFLHVVSDIINSNSDLYTAVFKDGGIHTFDFGKYNLTSHEHTCVKLLRLKNSLVYNVTNELIRAELPFIFNETLFDPIAAADDILYHNAKLDGYTSTQQEEINQCIAAINTTGQYVLDSYPNTALNAIKWINKLNTNIHADERLLTNVIDNIKTVFDIDITSYMTVDNTSILTYDEKTKTWWGALSDQFNVIDTFTTDISENQNYLIFDVDSYVNDIYSKLLSFANKLSVVREDLSLLTLRNALKGTAAIVQLATAEYLNEHLADIVNDTIDEVIDPAYRLSVKSDQTLIDTLTTIYNAATLDSFDVQVIEYWDSTEYYGRTKNDRFDMYPADWNTSPMTAYGTTSEYNEILNERDSSDIVRFYHNVLGLSKTVLKTDKNKGDLDLSVDKSMDEAEGNLIKFLTVVYNAGIFNKALPNNIEKIFSGNPTNAILRQFYTNFKTYYNSEQLDSGIDRISKQIHPYIWNFTTRPASLGSMVTPGTYASSAPADSNGSVTNIKQDIDIELLNEVIDDAGNIVDQWRLDISKFIDDSNYWTRYEAADHPDEELLLCYDGYVYPPFAAALLAQPTINATSILNTEIDTTNHKTLYDIWYTTKGKLTFKPVTYAKENLVLQQQLSAIQKSVNPTEHASIAARTTMQNYTVDSDGTSYGVDTADKAGGVDSSVATVFYKEAAYPFMRPLRQTVSVNGINKQLGLTFIDSARKEITDFSTITLPYTADKNHFPGVIANADGDHLLIRLDDATLGFFVVTDWITSEGVAEKALQLKYLIDCNEFIGDKTLDAFCKHITEGGIKTLTDSIAILLTDIDGDAFNEYLLIVSPAGCKISKQIITCDDTESIDRLTAGLTLCDNLQSGEMRVIVTTFGFTSDVLNYNYITGFRYRQDRSFLQTPIEKTLSTGTSFDICKQFIHMLATSNVSGILTLKTDNLRAVTDDTTDRDTYTLTTTPIKTIEVNFTEIGFAYSNAALYDNTVIPFARRFNINSDAGFNPCYIGDSGKLILSDRISQHVLAKTAGIAVELLGPEAAYDTIVDEDLGQNQYIVRIHETDYSAVTEYKQIPETYDFIENTPGVIKSAANYSVYAPANTLTGKRPRLFTCKLDHFCTNPSAISYDDTLDIYSPNDENNQLLIINRSQYVKTDDSIPTGKVGVAYLLFKTGDSKIWMPTVINAETVLDDADFNKTLFNIIFNGAKGKAICKYSIVTSNGSFSNPYIFDTIYIERFADDSDVVVRLSGSIPELINIEVVVIGVLADIQTNGEYTTTPHFMLLGAEYTDAIDVGLSLSATSATINETSFHNRAPHSTTEIIHEYDLAANDKTPSECYITYASDITDISTGSYTIDTPTLKDGSLTMSIVQQNSIVLGNIIPNLSDTIHNTGKSVLAELLNDMNRCLRLNENIVTNSQAYIDYTYAFTYYQFEYLNMVADANISADVGDSMYYVQLTNQQATTSELDYLKQLTYSAWRVSEDNYKTIVDPPLQLAVENTLPKNIKVTEHVAEISAARPIYINANIGGAIQQFNVIPKIGIRWQWVDDDYIQLRFDNATLADAVFINENNNLSYISLANANSKLEIDPGEAPELFDVVSPIHIIAGNTVFTDIPLAVLLLSNISDDKPKFMMTVQSLSQDIANGDAYALVFDTGSTPEIENLNSITTHCYVAKLDNLRQTILPQIDSAVKLKQLTFNMNISNILNTTLNDTVDARDRNAVVQITSIYGKTPTHIIAKMKQASAIRNDNNETIKIVLKADVDSDDTEETLNDKCFSVVDFFIHFHDVTKYTLKNALIGAKVNETVAIDKNDNKLYIAKVFGCDFNKIGIKRVLGTMYGDNSEYADMTVNQKHWLIPSTHGEPNIPIKAYVNDNEIFPGEDGTELANVVVGTQANTGRTTAILVNNRKHEKP